jgi:hypothetical protein
MRSGGASISPVIIRSGLGPRGIFRSSAHRKRSPVHVRSGRRSQPWRSPPDRSSCATLPLVLRGHQAANARGKRNFFFAETGDECLEARQLAIPTEAARRRTEDAPGVAVRNKGINLACCILPCRRACQIALQCLHRHSKFCPVPLLHGLLGLIEQRSSLLQGRRPYGARRLR